ncbi:hypothetical protein [Chryseobacterium sp. Leaf394]|uniref:hypothetical protein n=1 Tax=Chryseobacterium sp. Leaf394 TaxID=1736361 RepID=UPI000701BAEA|nr:hypothetical protein [Chryseobacterium sp. Leaf394]KQS92038.1 hypothetical protein ASG21_06175 [Chryseobacterium sp. Leaf394]
MKKLLIIVASVIIFIVLSITIYWNLPIEITRKSDIESGNKIIQNIENYKKTNGKLPENGDWKTLEKLGFKFEKVIPYLDYTSDNKGVYELTYIEGFDGPYLMWNSNEKKWTIDFPKIND